MRLWSGVVAVAVLAGAPAARVDEGMVPTIGESPAEAQSTSLSESGFQVTNAGTAFLLHVCQYFFLFPQLNFRALKVGDIA